MPMNLGQARVVDPVLSNHALGYKHPERVGSILFPRVDVDVTAGKVIEFGKESFLLYNARRAPGAATKQIDFGYLGKPYELVQDSLEGRVPREFARDAAAVPGIDLGLRAVGVVMQALTLTLEHDQATIATNPNTYDADHKTALAGADKWSTGTGTPIDDIETAKEAIRVSCGVYPNVMVVGALAYKALKNNATIVDRFKYTSADSITAVMLANLFELERVAVGKAVVANNDGGFTDVWGNNVVLAYAPQTPGGFEEPSFGYTYTMRQHPFVEAPYWDGNRKSWLYGVTYERQPVLAGMSAGYLIETPA